VETDFTDRTTLCVACAATTFSIPLLALSPYHVETVRDVELSQAITVLATSDGRQALELLLQGAVDAAFATLDAWVDLEGTNKPGTEPYGRLCQVASGKTYAEYVHNELIASGEDVLKALQNGQGLLVCRPGTNYYAIGLDILDQSKDQLIAVQEDRGEDLTLLMAELVQNVENLPMVVLGLPGWVRRLTAAVRLSLPASLSVYAMKAGVFGEMTYHLFLRRGGYEKSDIKILRKLLCYLLGAEGESELQRIVMSLNSNSLRAIAHAEHTTELDNLISESKIAVNLSDLEPSRTLDLWTSEVEF